MSKFATILLAVLIVGIFVGNVVNAVDWNNCNELEDGFGYAKYKSEQSCIMIYTDKACTNEKSISSSISSIGTWKYDPNGRKVCNEARDRKPFIEFGIIGFVLLVTGLCLKLKCCKDDKKHQQNTVANV